ncbi:MAG: FAD:protein FMN transferase [Nitrospirae bacterium]|nr:FAD:protein FMN transferase [Nitrospirota bacterium]
MEISEKNQKVLKNRKILTLVVSLSLLVVVLFGLRLLSDQYRFKVYKKSRVAMDTLVTLTVVAESPRAADDAMEAGMAEVDYLDHLLSIFNENSEVTLINRNAGIKPVKVSMDTFNVIKRSIEVAGDSDGAFDPSIGPLSTLWDFIKAVKPSGNVIHKKLHLINYKHIAMDERQMTVMLTKKGMSLDLGGIAKGYVADRVVAVLQSKGINSGIAAMAGDIKTFGSKPHTHKLHPNGWKVGIRDPRGEPESLKGVLNLQNMAISTAGDYERFFIENGVRYHHILDPETGYPAREFQSVTIVNPEGVLADGLDTAIFVLGKDKGLALIRRMNLRAYIVFSDGSTYITDNLKEFFEPVRNTKDTKDTKKD